MCKALEKTKNKILWVLCFRAPHCAGEDGGEQLILILTVSHNVTNTTIINYCVAWNGISINLFFRNHIIKVSLKAIGKAEGIQC